MKQFIFTLLLSALCAIAYSQELEPGSDLPKGLFYKSDGKTFSTEQIAKGKKTLLMFFDATCSHCQRAAGVISKRSKELKGINLYLITQDEQQSIDYFINNYAKPLASMKNVVVLQDRDHVFIPLFHPEQYPSLYLYTPDKKLIFKSSSEKDVPKFFTLIK